MQTRMTFLNFQSETVPKIENKIEKINSAMDGPVIGIGWNFFSSHLGDIFSWRANSWHTVPGKGSIEEFDKEARYLPSSHQNLQCHFTVYFSFN